MRTLALDVDGVLLDPDRAGDGHWTDELQQRFGFGRPELREHFFSSVWEDVITGRRAIEPTLGAALAAIGTDVGVEDVLACWFEADFVPFEATIGLARRASAAGVRVVLATNQEHRRAEYLVERLAGMIPVDAMFYSADLGVQKHEPEFFRLAGDRLGGAPSDVVFVDDGESNVDEARQAGWRGVHARPGADWRSTAEDLLGAR